MSSHVDGLFEFSLMVCACPGHPSRHDLAPFGDEMFQHFRVFVVYGKILILAETANPSPHIYSLFLHVAPSCGPHYSWHLILHPKMLFVFLIMGNAIFTLSLIGGFSAAVSTNSRPSPPINKPFSTSGDPQGWCRHLRIFVSIVRGKETTWSPSRHKVFQVLCDYARQGGSCSNKFTL